MKTTDAIEDAGLAGEDVEEAKRWVEYIRVELDLDSKTARVLSVRAR
jgi:hypothetical protein